MLRFTIRDVLWLTLVMALGAGWFVHVRRLEMKRLEAAKIHHGDLRYLATELARAKAATNQPTPATLIEP